MNAPKMLRMDRNKLHRNMIVELGPDDFRTITGTRTSPVTGSVEFYLDHSAESYALPAHVNIRMAG